MNTVKVRAISLGFDGFQRRKEGEVFYIKRDAVYTSDGKFRCSWLELVDEKQGRQSSVARSNAPRKTESKVPKASDPKAHVPPQSAATGSAGGEGEGTGTGSGDGDGDGGSERDVI
jgi:hypothetical protein